MHHQNKNNKNAAYIHHNHNHLRPLPDDEKVNDGRMNAQTQAQHLQFVEEHEAVKDSRRFWRQNPRVRAVATFQLRNGGEGEHACQR
jgi:hypothetical protein